MINELKEDVIKFLKQNSKIVNPYTTEIFVFYLIYLKYLCDTNVYKYEEVINNETLYDILPTDNYSLKKKLNRDEIQLNKLLRNISTIDAKKLMLEYINLYNSTLPIYDENKERLLIKYDSILRPTDLSNYDITGKTTYIVNKEIYYEYFKIVDKILGVNNKYLREEEIDFSKYQELCVIDSRPKYRYIKEKNIYDDIHKYINKVDKVILYTKYSKISNFKEGRFLLNHLKDVILYGDKAILIFVKNTEEVSIINYDIDKIKTIDKLKSIVNNNKKQKSILIKTNKDEILDNNSRIGFSLYELDKNNEIKDINKIVDENTELLEELNRINSTVEEEINKLLNR